MQIIGMGCILVATTLCGIFFGNLVGYRISDLKQLQLAITMLKAEIGYTLTPLPVACKQIADKVNEPISSIFNNLYEALDTNETTVKEAFEHALKENIKGTYLEKEDVEAILALGKSLGYLDKEMQLNNIDLMLGYIDQKIQELNPVYTKNKKMYQTLGAMAGLLIVVIFI